MRTASTLRGQHHSTSGEISIKHLFQNCSICLAESVRDWNSRIAIFKKVRYDSMKASSNHRGRTKQLTDLFNRRRISVQALLECPPTPEVALRLQHSSKRRRFSPGTLLSL